jgi:hypothetical protein
MFTLKGLKTQELYGSLGHPLAAPDLYKHMPETKTRRQVGRRLDESGEERVE